MGDPDSPDIGLKLCDFGYSKDELVRFLGLTSMLRVLRSAVLCCASADVTSMPTCRCTLTISCSVCVASLLAILRGANASREGTVRSLQINALLAQSESLCKTLCGTPEYIAPEVLIDNRCWRLPGSATQSRLADSSGLYDEHSLGAWAILPSSKLCARS